MRYTRVFAMLCCILIIFCLGTSVHTASEAEVIHRPRVDLRSYIESLTPDECIAFLEESYVPIPDFCLTEDTRHYSRGMILDILDDPYAHHFVGRADVLKFSSGVDRMLEWYRFYGCYPAVDAYVL